jgi:glycine hydroxymethyltransferase
MSQALSDGGNAANRDMGPPRFYQLKIVDLPYNGKEMNVELSKFEEEATRTKPKLIILGAMIMLFPHPLKEIIQVAKAIDSKVVYDGADVGALIAGGRFEDTRLWGLQLWPCRSLRCSLSAINMQSRLSKMRRR